MQYHDFKTSYVDIKLESQWYLPVPQKDFKTSYVDIKLVILASQRHNKCISKHHMLILNS